MNELEKEQWEIKIEAWAYSGFVKNSLIGSSSIGLATLYSRAGHELYQTWLPL